MGGGAIDANMTIVPTYDGKFVYFPGGEPQGRNDVCDFKASPVHAKAKVKRCWFWAKKVSPGDHLTLVFEKEIDMKAVFVELGHPSHAADLLQNGAIEVAATRPGGSAVGPVVGLCGPFKKLQDINKQQMVYWEVLASTPPRLPVP